MTEIVKIGDATLYHGDSLEWINSLPECFRVDAMVTDPPYNVNFTGKATKHYIDKYNHNGYISDDSDIGIKVVSALLVKCERAVVFPGSRLMFDYPKPYEIGCVYCPSGAGLGRWGFTVIHPILFYGKGLKHTRQGPSGFESFEKANEERHPCPKPVGWMNWSVNKCSLPGMTIIDPFMGSGTTGIACANLDRKFIGIEKEKEYFDLACERIEAAYAQGMLVL